MRKSDKMILADVYLRTNGNPVQAARNCYKAILERLGPIGVEIVSMGVTGSGRHIAGLHALTDNIINEIIAHATAAAHFDPEVDTIFEIGGQDAKYTYLTAGIPSDYAMNEACSAGTGSFLEEAAQETLGIPVEAIGPLALASPKPLDFTDQCAAFIGSDIKRASQCGFSKDDIVAGLVYSICLNYSNRVKGNRPVGRKVFMQGGVCYNQAVPIAMAAIMNIQIIVPPDPGLMGAYGIALEIADRLDLGLIKPSLYDLHALVARDAVREGVFICNGGSEHCDRKCQIVMLRIDGKKYPFGGVCNKYYNERIRHSIDNIEDLDLVAVRNRLLFDVFGPSATVGRNEMGHEPRSVGLNRSLLLYMLYPLYSNFFSRLGFKVVLSDEGGHQGSLLADSQFCLPVEIAHEAFSTLLSKKCDYIFLPQVMQIHVPNPPNHSRLCPFVQGETYYLRTTFRSQIEESGSVIVDPVIRMDKGYETAVETFVAIGVQLGVSERQSRNAFLYACEKQKAFEKELHRIGKKAIYALKKDSSKFGIVLFGRPYNAFAPEIHMGIPHKIASRGHVIIPFDMLTADEYPLEKSMFWGVGQKLMRAAQFVAENPHLYGVFITNFSCGPDSFLLGYFRSIMKNKPSLTLELDQHTADAGIDTRIDAAIDIITRYRKLNAPVTVGEGDFKPARLVFPYVYTSDGEKVSIHDPRVEICIPPFGHYMTEALAAIFTSAGYPARALPVLDKEGFTLGRRVSSGKECLPYIVTSGAFLRHFEKPRDPSKITLFGMATGSGPCRLGQYHKAFENVILQKKLRNAAMFTLSDENCYHGLGATTLLKGYQAIVLSDILTDIRSTLNVVAEDRSYAMEVLDESWKKCLSYFEGRLSLRFTSLLKFISSHLRRIPLKKDPRTIPVVSLVGEIYVRHDEFSRKNITEFLENRGIMVRTAPRSEYLCYSNYVVSSGLSEKKFSLKETVKMRLSMFLQEWWERKIKTILAESGLYRFEMIEVEKTIAGVRHLMKENFRGECILTVGLSMREIVDTASGVISIGPFGCMYSRMAEAMLKNEMNREGKMRMAGSRYIAASGESDSYPFLSVETDGNPFPPLIEANLEAFVLQVYRLHNLGLQNKEKRDILRLNPVAELLKKR